MHFSIGSILRTIGFLAFSTASLLAQKAPPPPPAASHDFDFWLGEWNVTTSDGKPAGTSRIESIASGWGLLENWTGTGGGSGKSLNSYNTARQQWQQYWVGSGGVLELAGGMVDGKMVLSGSHQVGGKDVVERITWTPNADGTVRQFWEQSKDGGKTWGVAFDGLYRRK